MKAWISILAGAMMLCALPVNAAAQAPDIIAFTRRIDTVSAFVASGELCRAAGYTIAPDVLDKTITPTLAQAVKDGIAQSTADTMMKASLEAAGKDEVALMRDYRTKADAAVKLRDRDALLTAANDLYKHVDARCLGFTKSPEFGALITAPESDGYSHFLNWLAES